MAAGKLKHHAERQRQKRRRRRKNGRKRAPKSRRRYQHSPLLATPRQMLQVQAVVFLSPPTLASLSLCVRACVSDIESAVFVSLTVSNKQPTRLSEVQRAFFRRLGF